MKARIGAILSLLLLVLVVILLIINRGDAQTVGTTLTWTATGDDGNVGRASQYDIRYRLTPIIGVDTLSWWNGAAQLTGEPLPSIAGSTDSMQVFGLASSSTYRFIIKAGDEVPNWSGYSNVAVKVTPDLIPPAAINDLR